MKRFCPNGSIRPKVAGTSVLVACPLVGFYFRAAKALTAQHRLLLIHRFSECIASDTTNRPLAGWRDADWTLRDGFLTVSLSEFVADADDRSIRLAAAQCLVGEDPTILGVTPIIRGNVLSRAHQFSTLKASSRLRPP